MSYNTSKMTTVAECDQAIKMANERKVDLEYSQIVTSHGLTGKEKSTALSNSTLLSTRAEITGTEAAIAVVPDGDAKDELVSKLRRLNDRKENLEERLNKGGSAALLDTELDAGLMRVQVTEIDQYIAEVEARKASL